MDSFYIVVLSIAAVILILLLTYIGIKMRNNKLLATSYPPTKSACPDYWNIMDVADPTDATKKIKVCASSNARNAVTGSLGTTPGYDTVNGYINFNDSGWTVGGVSALCAQKKWANSNNIAWDGISNYNGC